MILLALLGLPVIPTAEAWIYDTLLESALALIAYRVWPTWEGATAQVTFATLLEAHRNYATALLLELAHPGSVPRRSCAQRKPRSARRAATPKPQQRVLQASLSKLA